ncbi:pathogenesis-related protein 1A-like [Zingiber officinale]|uniref:SCP domain-containing protein n=1 Tax=Zingiber officinale TaxID=94328 RepID=A0A8J5G274_ZINOF|nr:pathogenesis-related protein 1A-like [Zingiber officinale]KAG6498471.1 hypothetical protein ZIOFF_046385 [Zingiber officinale]
MAQSPAAMFPLPSLFLIHVLLLFTLASADAPSPPAVDLGSGVSVTSPERNSFCLNLGSLEIGCINQKSSTSSPSLDSPTPPSPPPLFSPPPSDSTTAPPSQPPPPGRRGQDVREYLQAHNQVRVAEGEAPLEWDPEVARYARRWASNRRLDCAMVHSQGPYGENIFWGAVGASWTPDLAVDAWAEEAAYYDRATNTCEEGQMCGHYTQMVWNSTAKVGCALVECFADAGYIVICNYDPPGNYVGESPFDN